MSKNFEKTKITFYMLKKPSDIPKKITLISSGRLRVMEGYLL